MPVPDFQSFFKPILEVASDGKEHSMAEVRAAVEAIMDLNKNDMNELLPSGTQTKFDNRVAWASSYFVQAKVLERPRRAYIKITDRGRELHRKDHKKIDIRILNQYEEFVEFHSSKSGRDAASDNEIASSSLETPEELLQQAYQNIRSDLIGEVIQKIKDNSPKFFEKLVVDLMVSMGYGGSRLDAGKSIGQSGDEGIDGIINEDRLGLDVIYLQAKRWEGTVGRPEIQKFVGALHGKRAKKGVFITSGKFSDEAIYYVKNIDPKVILIDGRLLADFMIEVNLGVSISTVYEIKKIDSDYFIEE